jgi:predicted phosphoribosyltransferase
VTYADRSDAGDVLAAYLTDYADRPDVVVLGLVARRWPLGSPYRCGPRSTCW